MKRLKILAIPAAILAMLITVSACAVLKPIGVITVVEGPRTAERDISAPSALSVTAVVTGWVEAPAFILMDQKDTRTPEAFREPQWVPSVAYVVTHPTQGTVIFDFGLREGECDYGLKPVYWVPCRNDGYESLSAYLSANKYIAEDVRYLIPSHLHGDHVSGLSEVMRVTDAPLLITKAALRELKSHTRVFAGVPSEMLQNNMEVTLMDQRLSSDPVLGQAFDLFGDGSLKIFETPGHADGHISALAKTETATVFLTFDASHVGANYDLQIPSGSVSDKAKAMESLVHLNHVERELGGVQMVFGHDPEQWRCVKTAIKLDGVTPLGCKANPIPPLN